MSLENKENVKQNTLKSSRNLALSTVLSRMLGLLRELLIAHVLGGGMAASAWVFVQTMPNMFRRIFGEGALGTAVIPMLVHCREEEGTVRARQRFTTIFIWLTILMTVLTILISVPSLLLADHFETERFRLSARLIPFIMPYSIFICCVGVMTSYANSIRVYFLPSLAAVLQNIVIMGGLLLIFYGCGQNPFDHLLLLCLSVIVSGILELLLLLWILKKEKISMMFSRSVVKDWDTIKSIVKLAIPGMIGGSAMIASLVADRLIAMYLNDNAAAALYYSERLTYLPIGVFAFAFSTVSLSELSHAAVKKDYAGMADMMMFSIRNLLFLTIPITAFMFIFSDDLIRFIYMHGKFDSVALDATRYAMRFYVIGIPMFCANKVLVTGFSSRKDMITPMAITIVAVVMNIGLNLLLMGPMQQGGIALATVITAVISNLTLFILLVRALGFRSFHFWNAILMIAKVSLLTAFAGVFAYWITERVLPPVPFEAPVHLVVGGCLFAIIFFVPGYFLKIEELDLFISRFIKIKSFKR